MHGARNDFVVLDNRAHQLDDLTELAQAICDRRTGIGADGLLVIGSSDIGDVSMRVLNSDGSEAEMCGNGVRCVARYLDEKGEGGDLRVDTEAGIIETHVVERGDEYRIRVAMGTPVIERRAGDETFVSTGNPHVARFRKRVEDVDIETEGIDMQNQIPGGINLHIVAVEGPHELRVRHYERGAGVTMACGTGAVASSVAAIDRGDAKSPVTVHVPGGDLVIEWDGHGEAYMTGPALRVFDTEIDIRAFAHAR